MIKHIMKDGSVRSTIEGVVIPPTGPTKAVYNIIFNSYKKKSNKKESA